MPCSSHLGQDYVPGDTIEIKMGCLSQENVRLMAGIVPSAHAIASVVPSAPASVVGVGQDNGYRSVKDSAQQQTKLCTVSLLQCLQNSQLVSPLPSLSHVTP